MKTGSNAAILNSNFMWIVGLFIACSFTVLAYAQTETPPPAEPKAVKNATLESQLEELITAWDAVVGAVSDAIATLESRLEELITILATLESQLEELITTVYCYCGCTRETIEVCVCVTAGMLEKDFRYRLLAGQTVEQIRANYLDTFGPQFYAVMPAEGINLLAYMMPAVILVLAGLVVFGVLRTSRREAAASQGTDDPKQHVSDTTVKRVEADLERYKRQH